VLQRDSASRRRGPSRERKGTMRILVTGGTGFIGRRVVGRLRASGHELRCLARKTSDAASLLAAGAEVVIGDVTDAASVARASAGCKWVVNLANLFEFWVPDRREYHAVNVDGTRNVMEAALAAGAEKVVHVSTVAVYGDAAWPITETSELGTGCASEYARTKREGDAVAWALHRDKGLPLVTVMPGAVLGAGDPKAAGRYVRNIAQHRQPAQILTRSTFAFVYVGDVAEAIARVLERSGNIGEKYLLVAESVTFGQLNTMISGISGTRLPLLSFPDWLTVASAYACTAFADLVRKPPLLDLAIDQIDLMRQGLRADGSKASRELGFTYTPIRTALQEAIAQPARGA